MDGSTLLSYPSTSSVNEGERDLDILRYEVEHFSKHVANHIAVANCMLSWFLLYYEENPRIQQRHFIALKAFWRGKTAWNALY